MPLTRCILSPSLSLLYLLRLVISLNNLIATASGDDSICVIDPTIALESTDDSDSSDHAKVTMSATWLNQCVVCMHSITAASLFHLSYHLHEFVQCSATSPHLPCIIASFHHCILASLHHWLQGLITRKPGAHGTDVNSVRWHPVVSE